MKKLLQKDKKLRLNLKVIEKKHYILKAIFKNSNFLVSTRWNTPLRLKTLAACNFQTKLSSRCLYTVNRKRFHKLTAFSRHILLKLIRHGNVNGVQRSSW